MELHKVLLTQSLACKCSVSVKLCYLLIKIFQSLARYVIPESAEQCDSPRKLLGMQIHMPHPRPTE